MSESAKIYLQLKADPFSEAVLAALRGKITLPAVLLELHSAHDQDGATIARIVHAAQALDAAALIKDSIELAKKCKADGVHLSASAGQIEQYQLARRELPTDSIVGASAGLSRHAAMTIGEAGADYVAFDQTGEPGAEHNKREEQADLLTWWSELFEIPSVALGATSAHQGSQLADAGADFVGFAPSGVMEPVTDVIEQILSFDRMLSIKSSGQH